MIRVRVAERRAQNHVWLWANRKPPHKQPESGLSERGKGTVRIIQEADRAGVNTGEPNRSERFAAPCLLQSLRWPGPAGRMRCGSVRYNDDLNTYAVPGQVSHEAESSDRLIIWVGRHNAYPPDQTGVRQRLHRDGAMQPRAAAFPIFSR